MSDANTTAAEHANNLYAHLDSSAGDYAELLEELENTTEQTITTDEVQQHVQHADECLDEAFDLLDDAVLPFMETDGEGNAWFDEADTVQSPLSDVTETLEDAHNSIQNAIDTLQNTDTQIPVDFGAHDTLKSALRYLVQDAEFMRQLAEKTEANL